jgi:hypothetical protein
MSTADRPVVVWFGEPGPKSPWYVKLWKRLLNPTYTHVSVQVGARLYDLTQGGPEIHTDSVLLGWVAPHRFRVGLLLGNVDEEDERLLSWITAQQKAINPLRILWGVMRKWTTRRGKYHIGSDCMSHFLCWRVLLRAVTDSRALSWIALPGIHTTPDELFTTLTAARGGSGERAIWVGRHYLISGGSTEPPEKEPS